MKRKCACVIGKGYNKFMNRIIVSLTSYPARIGEIHKVLESLVNQTYQADAIILYLAEEQFPGKHLPVELDAFRKRGVEIHWCEKDLKSHKKYFYAFQEYPDDYIITADDDFYYDKYMIEELVKYIDVYPRCVLARRAHLITAKGNQIAEYSKWWGECTRYIGMPRMDIFSTTGGGVLYPPHIFCEAVFDQDEIIKKCLHADDIWLKIMETICDVPTVLVGTRNLDIPSPSFSGNGLYQQFNDNGGNDKQLNAILQHYNYYHSPEKTLTQKIFQNGFISCDEVEELKEKDMILQVESWIEKINNYTEIVIYGAGKVAKRLYHILEKHGLDNRIKAFVVTDCACNPCEIYGIPVIEYTDTLFRQAVYIIGNANLYEQFKIVNFLMDVGIDEKNIEQIGNHLQHIFREACRE